MDPKEAKKKKIVLISEAAKFLGVSIDTVRRWDKSGILHSSRPDGKNRYFSMDELEKIKFSQPLTMSEAAERLGISTSVLRRLEKKGLIKPERNKRGERVFTRQCLKKFLGSQFYLRKKQVEAKILTSLEAEELISPSKTLGKKAVDDILVSLDEQFDNFTRGILESQGREPNKKELWNFTHEEGYLLTVHGEHEQLKAETEADLIKMGYPVNKPESRKNFS